MSTLYFFRFPDAQEVHIREEDYTVHEVANALKRFFRNLDNPILTNVLYDKWIEAAGTKKCLCDIIIY